MKKGMFVILTVLVFLAFFTPNQPARSETTSSAGQGDAELAQELSNPLADLMSIPFQMNYDRDIGRADDGWKLQTNIQPVIPFGLNENWNLITRTIVPNLSKGYLSRCGFPIRTGRHQSEPVFLAKKTDFRRYHLGNWACAAPAHSNR